MTSPELRQQFLDFFASRGHAIVPSSSLLPADPSVLFTTAGMQQFKEYYTGKPSPYGPRTVSAQKCLRTSDIDEAGDERHLTFFEMLGNFSFGSYFKKETVEWALEFLIANCKLPIDRLWVTVFEGDQDVPQDKESLQVWLKLGIPPERIFGFGRADNFWGPTGREGPCGPTSEIHYDLTRRPCQRAENCRPNCECGRFIELWNLVFNEYYFGAKGDLAPLEQKGVDTGMGLERLAMVAQNKKNVFETDLFSPLTDLIKNYKLQITNYKQYTNYKIQNTTRAERVIADHIKAVVFLTSEDIIPSNVEQGYVVRRLLRRAMRFAKILSLSSTSLTELAKAVIGLYVQVYPELPAKQNQILAVIEQEQAKFARTLDQGLRQFEKIARPDQDITGPEAFRLYDTYGFPLELTEELARERGLKVDQAGFAQAFEKHQEVSKIGAVKKFGGVGIEKLENESEKLKAAKLHTATHLLHAVLRQVLGKEVRQMGSDVSPERLRFDFSFPRKLTAAELSAAERLVNDKIKAGLAVSRQKMSYQQAVDSGALAFFKEKYPPEVTVYAIGDFSKEICAGPHVKNTSEVGRFEVVKEESVAAGVRRIRAVVL